jgi:amino acid transporter
MWISVTVVAASYLIPVFAISRSGIDPNSWTTGGWVDAGRALGGPALAAALTIGGIIGAIGTFNALMMSFSRLPLVMGETGALPKIFSRTSASTGAPYVAIIVCAFGWAACTFLSFERLIILDVLVTGLSIMLEFWALIGLRLREPNLARPYRVPGGMLGAIAIGLPPLALMIAAGFRNHSERIGSINALYVGAIFIAAGPVLYCLSTLRKR